ncbi:hypothetical protein WJX81_005399 [Elliptochloris bilobata]|uniref:CYTH domain-containing protein n=1 Tax=Elliptochloris bilobata TaxID=381761 RepID=A0AAW1SK31_9CHLO
MAYGVAYSYMVPEASGGTAAAAANTNEGEDPSSPLLKDALEIVEVKSDGHTRYTIKPLEDQLPFDKGFYVFIRALQALTVHNKGVVLVGLAGPSGSGKTVFSEKVRAFMPGCVILSMDNYNDASRVIDGNFDDPRLTDYELLLQNISDLKAGRAIKAPTYDFKASARVGYRDVRVPASRVVIIEGIYALSSRIRPLLDLRVSVTGGVHFDLVKRVLRDISRSGQAPEEIIQQISDTVYPMYKAYIEPDLKTAHLRIYNTFNPFSGFMAPTYILKSAKPVALEAIPAVLKANHTRRTESETYDIYLLPPNEDPETCSSWLRMRNRDGRYNLMFEEWVTDGPFIISPRITFEVSVRILGGLMALGYQIGTIMKRTSAVFSDDRITVKLDNVEGMEARFVQIQGKARDAVEAAGRALGLEGTYIPKSYIEQVQLEKLTSSFQSVSEDLRRRFVVDGEPLLDPDSIGSSPVLASSLRRTTGFAVVPRPVTMASSAPVALTKPRALGSAASSGGLLSHQMRGEANGNGHCAPAHGSDGSDRSADARASLDAWEKARCAPATAKTQADGLAAQLASMDERLRALSSRPTSPAPDIQPQLQALVAAQQALGARMHELATAVLSLDRQSAARDQASLAATAAACVLAGAAAALAAVCVFRSR